ncbi:MAG: linear amide C-N hydrolase [Actinobacteria bacterium]|nr:linear amide C-N hydrolase [Actinomycetota bacterium]
MCTRIFWSTNPVAKVVSRTLDWAVSDEPDLWYLPTGIERTGGVNDLAARWKSKYASLVLSMWRLGSVDGVNERGLAAHTLYLEGAEMETGGGRPTVSQIHWVQFVLDSFATVDEAVAGLRGIRVASEPVRGQHLGAHFAIEDPTGDSAIFEPIGGEIVVHHGAEFTVLANDPVLDEQLKNLSRYRPFGGELPPPGDITSKDRFVRANYFLNYLPEPADSLEAVAGVLHLASNASVPYGAPYDDGGVYPTWWMSAVDLTNMIYYFWSTLSPALLWVNFTDVDPGSGVLSLNPRDPTLVGDVYRHLKPATPIF